MMPTGKNVKAIRCKGCGGILVFYEDGSRAVGHEKPTSLIGIPNSVRCDLFNRLSAEQLRAMHADVEERPEDKIQSIELVKG